MNAKMSLGDNAPVLGSSIYPGSRGERNISTAAECRAIYDVCIEDGRFPGEHVTFISSTGYSGPLLEVVQECAGMGSFITHMDNDGGYIMVSLLTGYVVGFVCRKSEKDGFVIPNFGLAYIGG